MSCYDQILNTTDIARVMESSIQIKLFASLQKFMPASAENYAIEAGITVRTLLQQLDIPEDKIQLVFIDSVRAELTSTLKSGERVGIFPLVGGG
jgi:molybdopterin converting factor small subunit